jgi:accessory gene regulator B
MDYSKFCRKCVNCLSAQRELSLEMQEILAYAIEILTINLFNLIFTLLFAWILGVLDGTAICLTVAILFRYTAGGAHSKSPYICAVMTIVLFPLLAVLARQSATLSHFYTILFSVIAVISAYIAVSGVFSSITPQKTAIRSEVRRKNLKVLALGMLFLLSVVIVWFNYATFQHAIYWQQCVALSVLWISFMMTKWGYLFVFFIDNIILNKGGEEQS